MSLSLEIESTGPLGLAAVRAALEALGPEPRVVIKEHPNALELEVHPAAEPLAIAAHGDRVRLSAKTGTAGAGLHAWVVDLVDHLERHTGVGFDRAGARDPSGFVRTRDVGALLHFQSVYLSEVARRILELLESGHSSIALGMPEDVVFEHDELASGRAVMATPLGPRSRDWLVAVRRDGTAGFDALPWAEPGIDAAYHRGAALSLCWTELRYRSPLDDGEKALFDRVLEHFERAYALDPAGRFDWSLWSELFQLRGEESLRATRTHFKAERDRTGSRVGYRRSPVVLQIGGGWRLRLPGAFATAWEEGGRVWNAWDGKRSLHVSTVRATGAASAVSTEATLQALLGHDQVEGEAPGEVMLLKRGPIRGRATVRRLKATSPDEPGLLEVRALSAVGPHGAFGTFVVRDEEDRVWALEVWGTLDHDDARDWQPS
jgi:hypothetical protein